MVKPIDVVVADKNPLIVSGLKALVGGDERFRVVATATDGERFLEAVARIAFDVGVIGWVMPYLDGRGVLEALRARAQAPRVIVYTGAPDPAIPRQVMWLGGVGFCSKSDPPEKLLETVVAVAAGRMVFPIFDVRAAETDPLAALTPREREMLAALAKGAPNAELARSLGISLNTVKFHLKNMYDKLQVKNRTQAVALYVAARRS